jgi:hypothetical protein
MLHPGAGASHEELSKYAYTADGQEKYSAAAHNMLQGRGEGQRVMNPWKTPHLNHKGGISDQESGSASRTWTSGIRISFCYSRVVVFFSLSITDFAFSLTPFPKGHTAARPVPPLFRPLSSVLRSKAGECRKLGQSVLLVFPNISPVLKALCHTPGSPNHGEHMYPLSAAESRQTSRVKSQGSLSAPFALTLFLRWSPRRFRKAGREP